jgi:hypothetical protein
MKLKILFGFGKHSNGVSVQKKISIDSEICGFSEISAGDAYRFGSKTTELALIYRLLSKIKGVKVPAGVGISANVLYMFFSGPDKMKNTGN